MRLHWSCARPSLTGPFFDLDLHPFLPLFLAAATCHALLLTPAHLLLFIARLEAVPGESVHSQPCDILW